ncbi:MAG: hypothetical protein SFV21_03420 [Rhodospirillaceae bacterium]|nr:hypothetical protein [Rhodospirillaceae bacterium]
MTVRTSLMLAAAAMLWAGGPATAQEVDHSKMDHSQMDHSKMDHSGHDMGLQPMDAEGRRKSAMAHSTGHKMGPEVYAEMRRNIPTYRALTDNEMDLAMGMMGDDMEWYVSDKSLTGEVGVLILAHGTGGGGDRILRDAAAPVADKMPTAIGFGMAMMASDHLQAALDDLTAAGAKTIVVMAAQATESNSLSRQWAYIFGRGDKVAYATVPRVKTSARLIFVPAYGFNPTIAGILLDHAREVSADPGNEVVILVTHGPEEPADNEVELANLQRYADHLKAEGKFSDVKAVSLQDDALPALREGNVKKMRRYAQTALRQGKKVLIVPAVGQSRGIQQKLYSDLDGLAFTYNEKGLSQHPAFSRFIGETVQSALAGS